MTTRPLYEIASEIRRDWKPVESLGEVKERQMRTSSLADRGRNSMTLTQAGYVVADNEAIHGIGDTEDAAWADMQRNFDAAGITLLPDGADSTDELGSWTHEGNLKTLPASARVLAAVEAGGGNIAWSVVGGIACTPDEAGKQT